MSRQLKILASLAVLIAVVAAIWLSQKPKPKCECYFPNTGKYGVKDEKLGCNVVDCEPPK